MNESPPTAPVAPESSRKAHTVSNRPVSKRPGALISGINLPAFPWDSLAPYRETALEHPQGMVDLSVGTPVDDAPLVVQQALSQASNSPGYPSTVGSPQLRQAVSGWLARQRAVQLDPSALVPTVGSKELVAWLPTLLGLGPGDGVVHPSIAYPTYAIGAHIAGCTPIAADLHLPHQQQVVSGTSVKLVWINSPANPTGAVLDAPALRSVVSWAREQGAVVASDECYAGFVDPAGVSALSVLHPQVCQGSHENLLMVHSLSKRSSMAGYRAGVVAGDPRLVDLLIKVRQHAGMMVPGPVQQAMVAAYNDDEHAHHQSQRYEKRRAVLRSAFQQAGFQVNHSQAGLYLWVTRGEDCWHTLQWLAHRGILATPGSFYGIGGSQHVRVALTISDESVQGAVLRLSD